MKTITKNIIRIWITLASLFAFTIGWITLSHSETQAALNNQAAEVSTTTQIELAPVPSLEELTQSNRPRSGPPSFTITTPRLRTAGS